jgi:imidazole glycerol-phosphate synthase subunit HisH
MATKLMQSKTDVFNKQTPEPSFGGQGGRIAIIKYNAGNVQSVQYALQRIGVESAVTDDAAFIQAADKVIFPGVGHAGSAMEYLKSKGLDKIIAELKQPVLGICLGMQLMCRHSALFNGVQEGGFVYTVNSYYAALSDDTVAKTDYIFPYSAALQKNNFYGVQFHPEKSGTAGETILKNFIQLT